MQAPHQHHGLCRSRPLRRWPCHRGHRRSHRCKLGEGRLRWWSSPGPRREGERDGKASDGRALLAAGCRGGCELAMESSIAVPPPRSCRLSPRRQRQCRRRYRRRSRRGCCRHRDRRGSHRHRRCHRCHRLARRRVGRVGRKRQWNAAVMRWRLGRARHLAALPGVVAAKVAVVKMTDDLCLPKAGPARQRRTEMERSPSSRWGMSPSGEAPSRQLVAACLSGGYSVRMGEVETVSSEQRALVLPHWAGGK